jgi:hypothetical protein
MVTRLQRCLVGLVRDGLDNRKVAEADLAAAVGISPEYLDRMLSGEATGTLIVWDKLLWQLMIPTTEVDRLLDEEHDPFKDPQWLSYADHVRNELIPKIRESAVTMSMVTGSEPDPKMAMETGYMILLDKPIITVVTPGASVPAKLALVSDAIVRADLDKPEQAAQAIQAAISGLDL